MKTHRYAVGFVVAIVSAGTLSVAGLSQSSWPMVQGGPQHLGRTDQIGPTRGLVHWVYRWPGSNAVTPPVVGRDGIYFSTARYPIDGHSTNAYLVAVNFKGSESWRFTQTDTLGELDHHDALSTVPAVTDAEHVWFSSFDGADANKVRVFEVNQDGSYASAYHGGRYAQSAIAIDAAGGVFFTRGTKCALNRNWTAYYPGTGCRPGGGPALSPDEQTVYIGTGDKVEKLLALDTSNMTLRWAIEPSLGDLYGVPLVVGTNVYFSTVSALIAVADAGTVGNISWTRTDIGTHAVFGGLALGFNGRLYSGENSDGTFYCLDPLTGTNFWTRNFGDGPVTAPVIDGRGDIYVGFANTLFKIRDDGTSSTVLWDAELEGRIVGLALGPGPWLYATTDAGCLYCIGSQFGTLIAIR